MRLIWRRSAEITSGGTKPGPAASHRHHLPRLHSNEAFWRNAGFAKRGRQRFQRRIHRLIGQLHGAPMMAQRQFGIKFGKTIDRFIRVLVLAAHEPARFIGANRQGGDFEAAEFFPRAR